MALSKFDLSGKTVLVTGGNSGIGLGFAEGLAEAGANVCIWGRNADRNQQATSHLRKYGTRVVAMRCDVSDEQQVEACFAKMVETFGSNFCSYVLTGEVGAHNLHPTFQYRHTAADTHCNLPSEGELRMAMTDARPSTDVTEMLAALERIRPTIEQHRAAAEADRRLAEPVYRALIDSGLMGMTAPRAYGGREMAAVDLLTVWEAVSRIDSAVGWNLVMNSSVSLFAAHLPESVTDTMFADGYGTLAGAFNPPGTAVRVTGGWRVDGQIPFASGCHYAEWALFPFVELVNGEPVLDDDTGMPVSRAAIVPMSDLDLADTWHTMGMRGTGSADMVLRNVFAADEHVFPVGPLTNPNPKLDGPLARMFPLLSVHGETVVSIAAAAESVALLQAIAAKKAASYTAATLRDREYIQVLVGKAHARVQASRSYLHQACNRGYAEATAGNLLSDGAKIEMQLAACFAAEQCAEAVRLVHEAAGTSGIRIEAGLERLFRDTHTLTQHASKSIPRYGSAGRLLLGLPNDWVFLSF